MADPVEPKVEKAITAEDINEALVLPNVNVKKEESSEKASEENQPAVTEEELVKTNFSFAVQEDTSTEQETDLELGQASLETNEDYKKSYSTSGPEVPSQNQNLERPIPTILDRLISFIADKLKALEKFLFGKEKVQEPEPIPENQMTAKKKDRTKKKKGFGLSTDEEDEEDTEEDLTSL